MRGSFGENFQLGFQLKSSISIGLRQLNPYQEIV